MVEKIRTKYHISVFWPDFAAPEIVEVQFSYQTCRRVSFENCSAPEFGIKWTDYDRNKTLGEALAETYDPIVLLVSDPEIVFSASGLSRLAESIHSYDSAAVPVYNETTHPLQRAALPYLYYNLTTLTEVADILHGTHGAGCAETDEPDPGCILYKRDFLESLDAGTLLPDVYKQLRGKKIAIGNVLVHRFANYYYSEREDLIRLIPDATRYVLDVGCAMGGYGRKLKQIRPEIHLTGVEMNPVMAENAAQYYDNILLSPVENADFNEKFDLINCGDILEHLYAPWEMLKHFHRILKPDACLILSVPNAGHWSVVSDLLQGKFHYIPVGLLCVTHIRWFTELSIQQALRESGFEIDTLIREQQPPTPNGQIFIDEICQKGYGDRTSLLTHELIIRAVKK